MAFTHIESVNTIVAGSTSTTVQFAGAITAGDFLACVFRIQDNPPVAGCVSDNVNGNWTIITNSGSSVGMGYVLSSGAAAANSLTITVSSTASGTIRICAGHFGTAGGTVAFIAHATNTAGVGSSAGNLGTIASDAGNNLLYGGIADGTGSRTYTAGTSNGVAMTTGTQATGASGTIWTEYLLATTAGTQTPTWTVTGGTVSALGECMTFSITGGAAFMPRRPLTVLQAVNRASTY